MGADIYGWVEVCDEEDELWRGLVNASMLMERDYRLFGMLFGVRNSVGDTPVAPHRGLPANISSLLQMELATWEVVVSPSWITWEELQGLDWSDLEYNLWNHWKLLFGMMRSISEHFGASNTRLVVWFDQ